MRLCLAGFACVVRSFALVYLSERVSASRVIHWWLRSGKSDFQALSGLEVNRGSLSSAVNQCRPASFLTNKVRLCERSEPQSEPFVGQALDKLEKCVI